MTAHDDIREYLGAPARAHEEGGWEDIEPYLGTELPADYKWFMDFYGGGDLNQLVKMPHPRSSFSLLDFYADVSPFLKELADRPEAADGIPFPIAPAQGGLVPWGESFEGDQCVLIPPRGGSGWRVGIWYREGEWAECDLGFLEWLLRELGGWSGSCSLLRYSVSGPRFDPWR
jgi:hypothetical protein